MIDWNSTEHLLRFWKPRGPSPRLKARLFPAAEHAASVRLEPSDALGARWAWLAPVMGCFLAMMVVSHSRTSQLGYLSETLTTDWLAAVASNQSYAAYIVTGFHSEQNALQNEPIEWTNGSRVSNDSAPIQVQATNTPNRN